MSEEGASERSRFGKRERKVKMMPEQTEMKEKRRSEEEKRYEQEKEEQRNKGYKQWKEIKLIN